MAEPFSYAIKNCANRARMIKNEKLNAEKIAMYFPAFVGLCAVYSRKVIKLARDAIRVPVPPIFTPKSRLR